jgi:hypothetical protein
MTSFSTPAAERNSGLTKIFQHRLIQLLLRFQEKFCATNAHPLVVALREIEKFPTLGGGIKVGTHLDV